MYLQYIYIHIPNNDNDYINEKKTRETNIKQTNSHLSSTK